MSRRKNNRFRKVFWLVFFGVLLGLGGYKGRSVAPHAVLVSCNHIYSDSLDRDIKSFINSYISSNKDGQISPESLSESLRKNFKVVKNIVWSWEPSGKALVVVEGVRPIFLVNNEFVLGDSNVLFSLKSFKKLRLSSLRSVSVDSTWCGESLDSGVYSFLKRVPDDYWKRYGIVYQGADCIVLNKKTGGQPLKLVVDESLFFDKERLKIAERIHDDFRRLKSREKNLKNNCVVYDMRFKDRICARVVTC